MRCFHAITILSKSLHLYMYSFICIYVQIKLNPVSVLDLIIT